MELAVTFTVASILSLASVLAGLWLGREAFQRSIPDVVKPFTPPEEPEESVRSPDILGMWPKEEEE